MAFSSVIYQGDGATTLFLIPFPFLSKEHITVTSAGVSIAFTWMTETTIQTQIALPTGQTLYIKRTTPKDTLVVDFKDASTLTEDDLRTFQLQFLYGMQEAYDVADTSLRLTTYYDAHGNRIINVGEPVDDADVATLLTIKTVLDNIDIAAATTATTAAQTAATAATQATAIATSLQAEVEASVAALTKKLTQIYVPCVSRLAAMDYSIISNGCVAFIQSYHAGSKWGGGSYVWDTSIIRTMHNGGTIISPSVPWSWADDGEGYLNQAGETSGTSYGCWVRADSDGFGPAAFGARRSTSYNSGPSINKSLAVYMASLSTNYIYDGDGVMYGSRGVFAHTGQVYRKHIKNLYIEALSSFSGDAILKFDPDNAAYNLNNLRISDCTFKGGLGQSSVSNVDYLLVLDNAQGVWIQNCEFNIAKVACIRGLKEGPGCEIYISNCQISASSSLNPGAAGVYLGGNDSHISNCVIRECSPHIWFTKGANFVTGTHIYNFTASRDVTGILCEDAKNMVITHNYIDGVRCDFKNPSNLVLNNNKFLLQNADDWTSIRTFVRFSTSKLNFKLLNIISTGNFFLASAGTPPKAYTSNGTTGGGSWNLGEIDNVHIHTNVFENVIGKTSHPSGAISVNGSGAVSVELTASTFLGDTYQNIYKHCTNITFNSEGSTKTEAKANIVGSVLWIQFTDILTGTFTYSCTCNKSGV